MTANSSSDERIPPDVAQPFLDQIFRFWVEPAIVQGNLGLARAEVVKVLVVFPTSKPPRVLINDEVQLTAMVRTTRSVEAGEAITRADIASLEGLTPLNVDPNAGWVAILRIGDEVIGGFDFRRNRHTAQLLIERGQEFLEAAASSFDKGHLGPAIENSYAAAELAVKAEMYLSIDSPTSKHWERINWWNEWVRLGNAPAQTAPILKQLYAERGASRYGDSTIAMSHEEVRRALEEVAVMIEHASLQSSDRPHSRITFTTSAQGDEPA